MLQFQEERGIQAGEGAAAQAEAPAQAGLRTQHPFPGKPPWQEMGGSSSCRELGHSKADASVFFHCMESFAHIYCSGIVFLPAVVLPAMSTGGWSSAVHWHSREDFEA